MSSLDELIAQRDALEKKIADMQRKKKADVIIQVKALISQNGLTQGDLFGSISKARKSTAGNTVPAKYKDPESDAMWSGRGKAPAWIVGKDRTKFLI
ncbi:MULTISPECIES: H-NS family nucleoid-associated regulatory protein [unclassified Polaromonas]|uniref:H-NS histone family protein n=1 Tax=unclassified Polaromonas TaxID=2638319 RepID=UPI000F082410|nr:MULTISPECIES: H-NS histone family protein [unclassified Polaromonas]AYQ30284.1 H-NS histone family protein [Polaromonas sp. SP1]QGJ18598.1 H-NS histone family protein [Polaromonas sp. Pch-P]